MYGTYHYLISMLQKLVQNVFFLFYCCIFSPYIFLYRSVKSLKGHLWHLFFRFFFFNFLAVSFGNTVESRSIVFEGDGENKR